MKTTKAILILAAALFSLVYPVSSKADTIFDLDLNVPNSAISGYTGPYAHVHIDLDPTDTTALVTFTSLTNAGNIYLMGDGSAAAVNVNGSFTLGTITSANAGTGFSTTPPAHKSLFSQSSGVVDGFGSFNLTIDIFDGFTYSADTISFILTGSWIDASHVLIANDATHNALAAAHIFVTSSPAIASNGALATGYASNGVAVPEPGILILLGLAMSAIGIAVPFLRKI
jgi:hypothetical protein